MDHSPPETDLYHLAGIEDIAGFYRDKFLTGSVLDPQYFDALNRFDMRYARTMWVYDNVRRNSTVLDLGCGEGLLALLKRKNAKLTGVDVSADLLAVAGRNGYDTCVVSPLTSLPFADASFDYIVSLDVLGHIAFSEKDAVLAEIKRVLRPDGVTLHGIETLDRERHQDYAEMSREKLRQFIQIDGHIGLETEPEVEERFRRFFPHVLSEPRYTICLSAEEFLKQADQYGVPFEADFLHYLRGLSYAERRAFDLAMGYVFGKISDLGLHLPPSGLYLLLKAAAVELGPFYNEHRDRRELFNLHHKSTPGDSVYLDRAAEFDGGWYPAEDLPPLARWMGRRAGMRFHHASPGRISLHLTTHMPDLETQPLELEFRLNQHLLASFSLLRGDWLELSIDVPAMLSADGEYELEIRAARTWQPQKYEPQQQDTRELSVAVCNLEVSARKDEPKVRILHSPEQVKAPGLTFEGQNTGRTAKVAGLDYKRGAREYPRHLDEISQSYLRTKPFYHIGTKPAGETFGIAEETHRYFCDFADLGYALSLKAGARILDVGCGPGWLAEYFARFGYEVTGIDISPEMIAVARERIERLAYGVDQNTPLRARFLVHDIEQAPLAEKFDAIICYDALHHFADEHKVFHHLAEMLDYGGLLFILEGEKPPDGSEGEQKLIEEMRAYHTLESPFSRDYLLQLIDQYGFKLIGDYVTFKGLHRRDSSGEKIISPEPLAVNYLLGKKVIDAFNPETNQRASQMLDSANPGTLRARLRLDGEWPPVLKSGTLIDTLLSVENTGDTLWLSGPTTQKGAVTFGVKLYDAEHQLLVETHGEPTLRQTLAPGESVTLRFMYHVPLTPGRYTLKIDLVAQHVSWFEQHGSLPLSLAFEVE